MLLETMIFALLQPSRYEGEGWRTANYVVVVVSVHRVAEAAAANFLTNSFDRNGRCESNEDLTFGIFAVHSGLKITQRNLINPS